MRSQKCGRFFVYLLAAIFDYFASGALLKPDGTEEQENLYDQAAQAGYTEARPQADAEKLTPADGKVLIVTEHMADSDSLDFEIDRAEDVWALSDYAAKSIELLDGDNGFFLVCESGKIDWACHANDVGSVIWDVLAMDKAVQVAMEFAARRL